MISFISSIIAQIQTKTTFPTFTWWAVVYYFFLIPGVFVVVASDTIQTYHIAVVGYLACGLVLTTSSVNDLVYSTHGANEACAAGFILLSMVTVSYSPHFRPRLCRRGRHPVGLLGLENGIDALHIDCLDLLLRLRTVCYAACVPGLFCAD